MIPKFKVQSRAVLHGTEAGRFINELKQKQDRIWKPPTKKQERQRKLSWALKITEGALASMQHYVPKDMTHKNYVINDLTALSLELRKALKEIP